MESEKNVLSVFEKWMKKSFTGVLIKLATENIYNE
jgi:hypothetical protein